jgi:hypothetical protein
MAEGLDLGVCAQHIYAKLVASAGLTGLTVYEGIAPDDAADTFVWPPLVRALVSPRYAAMGSISIPRCTRCQACWRRGPLQRWSSLLSSKRTRRKGGLSFAMPDISSKPTPEAHSHDEEAEREFWFDIRRALLAMVATIDRKLGLDQIKKPRSR